MAGFRITIDGNRLKGMDQRLQGRLRQVVAEAARNVQTRAVQAIEGGGKSGLRYERGGQMHQASAPGEAPAGETGALAASIQVQMDGELTARVVVTSEHGAVMELGGHRIAARPFLRPAAEAEARDFEQAVVQILTEEFGN